MIDHEAVQSLATNHEQTHGHENAVGTTPGNCGLGTIISGPDHEQVKQIQHKEAQVAQEDEPRTPQL